MHSSLSNRVCCGHFLSSTSLDWMWINPVCETVSYSSSFSFRVLLQVSLTVLGKVPGTFPPRCYLADVNLRPLRQEQILFWFFGFLIKLHFLHIGYITELKDLYNLNSQVGSTNKIRHMIQSTYNAEKRRHLLWSLNTQPCAPVRLVASLC